MTNARFAFFSRLTLAVTLMASTLVAATATRIETMPGDIEIPAISPPVNTFKAPSLSTQPAIAPDTSPRRHIYARQLKGIYPAETLRVIDGDTVEMRVSIWLGQEVITKVRLRDIDAPELRARCAFELRLAQEASDALKALLAAGPVFLTDIGYDKYGTRVVARIVDANSTDLGATLVSRQLARPYSGGKRQSWCDNPAIITGSIRQPGSTP